MAKKQQENPNAKLLTETKEEVHKAMAKLNKDRQEFESKRNQIGNFIWILKRKALSLSHEIANIESQIRIRLEVFHKTKYVRKMNDDQLEKEWEKVIKESGLNKALDFKT